MSALLEVKDLCVAVDGKDILHDIDLVVPDGEVHALLGPNGSGKTSLIMTIMGFQGYVVRRGMILFDGKDITELDITERARLGIGVGQQRPPTIAGVKLREVLEYACSSEPQPADRVKAMIETAHMEPFLDREINAGLSGGEIKRSELLQLLATHPRFAMMDEPDSGVDMDSLELVGSLINKLFFKDLSHPAKRNAGLIITHTGRILNYVQADKAHVMLNGRLACSGNAGLILNTACESGYEECIRCVREGA